jgi:hypothetical protein
MKHISTFKALLCGAFMCCITIASAQNTSQQRDPVNTADAAKLEQLQNAQDPGIVKQQQADAAQVAQDAAKLDQERQRLGYLNIPGFTFTGNPEVDAVNYENAKTAYKNSDPAGYEELLNSSGGGNEP